MTKEQALDKNTFGLTDYVGYWPEEAVMLAMDEYAKQQASAFIAWHTNKFNEYAALTLSGQAISGELWGEINRFECATIEGRYEIFIEQQSEEINHGK